MSGIPQITLHDGKAMPQLGLGVFAVDDGDAVRGAVFSALQQGYRSIDTASVYGNEKGVGQAIRESGIAREEIFLTTKVWNSEQGYESTFDALKHSLDRLGLDYVDLYLIHWPVADKFRDTWRAMEQLREGGLTRSIGVSNFQQHHLETLFQSSREKPVINQVELHPYLQQHDLQRFCMQQGIMLEAWAPLSRGLTFTDPVIMELASKYSRTVAQIILRWDIQRGVITIPKSSRAERIKENSEIFDFRLEDADMDRIGQLDRHHRIGSDPDKFHF